MERTMTVEERIRKAEDIYNRRNNIQQSRPIQKKKKEKNKSIKKLCMYIFIVLLIYVIFYAVQNREYVFSEEFRNEVTVFFTEKTKISEWFLTIKSYFEGNIA